ncbi:MAG: MBOAT family protein [Leptospiraceae bacterium]|nr:MBOAT family protein [Leptospiraceae bacterium]
MLFNSIEYFVFLTLTVLIYWILPHNWRKYFLLLASAFFYLSWSFAFLIHFAAVILINYVLFQPIVHRQSRRFLVLAIVINLINLALFKYFYFALDNLLQFVDSAFLSAIANKESDFIPEIILPLAISFYTFQIIALHVDAYRGQLSKTTSAWNFALFICFFPQLIAGPIVRHDQLLPQLDQQKDPERVDVTRGLGLIASGIIKKVFIADFLAEMVITVLHNPSTYANSFVAVAGFFFMIQVYCDFSAYTDFARGSALFLGYDLPINFRGPWFALSFQEHWRRWHISLSTWLRDYLYIGLGGSRSGEKRTYVNLFLTFFLGGVWHGAGWGFAVWGSVHGLLLSLERYMYRRTGWEPAGWGRRDGEITSDYRRRSVYNVFKWVLMMMLMWFAALFFYAGVDATLVQGILKGVFVPNPEGARYGLTSQHALVIVLFLFLHWVEYNDYFPGMDWQAIARRYAPVWAPLGALGMLFLSSWKAGGDLPFVYFQF